MCVYDCLKRHPQWVGSRRSACVNKAGKFSPQFKLTATNGTVSFHGIATYGGAQGGLTESLTVALAKKGSTVAPKHWDGAMLGVNASVFGFSRAPPSFRMASATSRNFPVPCV
eukprot:1527310-Prymnesium_polylepis.1